tara:strand:- start:475 stop:858 length:384 start_codon:yes stop_codon:yes gene_type:complete
MATRFSHFSEVPPGWWRWRNFSPREVACRHCGELVVVETFLNRLQHMRDIWGEPLVITSAYRCPIHNALVGGAPLSEHKLAKAGDIRLPSPPRKDRLIDTARRCGFTGLGVNYQTFLHVDIGRERTW